MDVNSRNIHGATVLHLTTIWEVDLIASARVLLQKGASQFHTEVVYEDDLKGSGPHSGTPAKIAREMGRIPLAKLLENWNYDNSKPD